MKTSTPIKIDTGRGHQLSARRTLPVDGHVRAWAIFAHCFTCSKNLRAARAIAQGLARHGIAVLSVDFTGLGQSEGEFSQSTFATDLDDLRAAAAFLREHHQAPALLVGHSLGGAAVLHVAASLPGIKAVATLGAPHDPAHVLELFTHAHEAIARDGAAEVSLAGRPFTITQDFMQSLQEREPDKVIRGLDAALLVLHAPLDQTVGIESATKIFSAALHPKSFVSLDGADHLLSRDEDALYAGEVIGRWAQRYMPAADASHTPDPQDAQVATRTGRELYHTDISSGRHALVADEPIKVGGQDHGPSPYELLLAALGACTGMTLRMYADRKQWPLEQVRVRLSHAKVAREGESKKIDEITRHVMLSGELTQEQRGRLLEIADRCPVHRTLHGEVVVRTALDEA